MQQNNKTLYLKLYIPGAHQTYTHRYNSISPNNLEFTPSPTHNISNHRYRLNKYEPASRKFGRESPKHSHKNSDSFRSSFNKTIDPSQKKVVWDEAKNYVPPKQSLSRMLQETGQVDNHNWQQIYKFFTKNPHRHQYQRSIKEQSLELKKSKQLRKFLKVEEMKPSFQENSKKRYAPTADTRCRCHQKAKINSIDIQREKTPEEVYRHHRFISTSQSKRKSRSYLLRDHHISRVPQKSKDKQILVKIDNAKSTSENWIVDSWKTQTKYSEIGDIF